MAKIMINNSLYEGNIYDHLYAAAKNPDMTALKK